jgi:hypothetical protein
MASHDEFQRIADGSGLALVLSALPEKAMLARMAKMLRPVTVPDKDMRRSIKAALAAIVKRGNRLAVYTRLLEEAQRQSKVVAQKHSSVTFDVDIDSSLRDALQSTLEDENLDQSYIRNRAISGMLDRLEISEHTLRDKINILLPLTHDIGYLSARRLFYHNGKPVVFFYHSWCESNTVLPLVILRCVNRAQWECASCTADVEQVGKAEKYCSPPMKLVKVGPIDVLDAPVVTNKDLLIGHFPRSNVQDLFDALTWYPLSNFKEFNYSEKTLRAAFAIADRLDAVKIKAGLNRSGLDEFTFGNDVRRAAETGSCNLDHMLDLHQSYEHDLLLSLTKDGKLDVIGDLVLIKEDARQLIVDVHSEQAAERKQRVEIRRARQAAMGKLL